MASPSIFSSSSLRFISTFKSQNYGRMMSTTAHGLINNPSPPCLMLPPTYEEDNIVYNCSSHGWLALFNERNFDVILTNPITRRHVKLPPRKSDEPQYFTSESGVSKVIISCDAEHEDCQAMLIGDDSRLAFCRPGRSPTEWTPLGGRTRPPYHQLSRCYEDIVYSRLHNLFFCVTETTNGDDFEAWDVASDPPRRRWENLDLLIYNNNYDNWLMRAGHLLEDKMGWFCEKFRCLVFAEQTDQLFFVTRHIVRQMAPDGSAVEVLGDDSYPYKTGWFDVHKVEWELDGEGGRLSHLDGGSLDGLAMFVGLNHSLLL
ncbi:hypothetical protein CASFOL_040845 [Castilleja foliolosa]|uniref:KIB1-4 beta-propeller domain-containing protein n=1 Tax=Castilleja foliolosa TaxID=1961234 RepID=A0ABD3BDD4_9LAMI